MIAGVPSTPRRSLSSPTPSGRRSASVLADPLERVLDDARRWKACLCVSDKAGRAASFPYRNPHDEWGLVRATNCVDAHLVVQEKVAATTGSAGRSGNPAMGERPCAAPT